MLDFADSDSDFEFPNVEDLGSAMRKEGKSDIHGVDSRPMLFLKTSPKNYSLIRSLSLRSVLMMIICNQNSRRLWIYLA